MRWVDGGRHHPVRTDRDLVTMTGNTAQAIADPRQWRRTLTAIRTALRPGGDLVLETRDPAARSWERCTPEATRRTVDVPGVGAVTSWVELTAAGAPLFISTLRLSCGLQQPYQSSAGYRRQRFGYRDGSPVVYVPSQSRTCVAKTSGSASWTSCPAAMVMTVQSGTA